MDIDINLRSKEEQIEIVNHCPCEIQYIKNPGYEVQLTAVSTNIWEISHIESPCLEVQLVAVNQDGRSIQCIKNPGYEVQLAAIQEETNIFKRHFEDIKPYITYPDLLELLELKIVACEE